MLARPDLDGWFFVGLWPLFAEEGSMVLWERAAKAGKVKTIAFDTLPVELIYMRKGMLQGLVGQKYWGWGYDTIQMIYDYIVNNKRFADWTDSGMDIVGPDNVAWGWNAVNPNQFDYMSYYPGDSAVDWWGINYFTTGQMEGSEAFVLAAATHDKPVIICESSPIHNDGTDNPANWQNWFVRYLNKIAGHAHLKAFTYISDPWDREGFWEEWATSLIDASKPASIRDGYAAEMDDPRYIHQPPRPVPAAAPTQRLILFALLLTAGVLVVGRSRARG